MLKKVRKFLHHRMALDILAQMRQDKGCCKAVEMGFKTLRLFNLCLHLAGLLQPVMHGGEKGPKQQGPWNYFWRQGKAGRRHGPCWWI